MTLEEAIAEHRRYREKHPDPDCHKGAHAQFILADAYLAHIDDEPVEHMTFPACNTDRLLCSIVSGLHRIRPNEHIDYYMYGFIFARKPENWANMLCGNQRREFEGLIKGFAANPNHKTSWHDVRGYLVAAGIIDIDPNCIVRRGPDEHGIAGRLPAVSDELVGLLAVAVDRLREMQDSVREVPE